ncbi:hypothetical protein PTNB73_07878 [Pyrenophora teres f. teres]|nr:hypothetical protein HRS9139_08072 [Pyrenophora teres f. teres]KAE8832418.1 hypothetical protein PTNB85_06810 [Pyrenophora teres f. teres]KAE8836974.1 hypothetical protein HRS9122_07129 [Pyrenophora teres f. teres]KAE8856080.1 hypothetical protein PTNB29_08919 [Pyrenophora teres f. teres]KAE8860268.1 hypothetical protein PTNB73_07878 [Pyrenophora teres f. teres]
MPWTHAKRMKDGLDADARSSEPSPETLDAAAGHGRSRSGGILASFLRSSKDDGTGKAPALLHASDDTHHVQEVESPRKASSMATVLRQSQGQAVGRQRKGSLRKAAMAKMRERSSSLRKPKTPTITTTTTNTTTTPGPTDKAAPPARFGCENAPLNSSSDSGWLPAVSLLASPTLATHPTRDHGRNSPPLLLASPMTMTAAYASTTDDDDVTSFYRPSVTSNDFSFAGPSQGLGTSLAHRRSTRSSRRTSVPTIATPAEIDPAEEWDYSETEWWGWVVLIATWIVFVVGMGSCLGVWSWAWDVGETPYAPPDLEDDATLPITGYYPALIVCTAVTSWVWVVVAWVGMKYFRHAKVGVDG